MARQLTLLAGLLARRAALLVVLLAVVFAAVEFLPGDAARSTVDRGSSAEAVAQRQAELGLDRPVAVRFAHWMTGVPTGDLGRSARGEPVADIIGAHLPNTLLLGGLAFALTVCASLALGCAAALRPGGLRDRTISTTATVALALPEFVVASVLVLVLALWADLLPAVTTTDDDGWPASPTMLVLPVLALAVAQVGWNTRILRAALADEYAAPHVDAAICDGLSPWRVLTRHVLPGALPSFAAGAATSVGMLLGGTVVIETIFNYPGIGTVIAGAVHDRDTPVIAGATAVTGAAIAGVLLLSDLVRAWATGRRA
ncbi:metal transporter [Longispora fulva]|uniref:Peptide/nickel transport system permease protein n=1 Tax=Longispora fulva TaxID=619741 RepID=A0A8J7GF82_9ACTN|nr:ABC transporter permease [Longispora fulva]MBG6136475.1 peptide/nickel transport system permease protein [Longispora fulva]GIG59644.1 metal transporter [Longispora fulva]